MLVASVVHPAKDRLASLVWQMCLAIPSHVDSISISNFFTKGFLKLAEYPPDAYRGFDVPEARISFPHRHNDSKLTWQVQSMDGSTSLPVTPMLLDMMQCQNQHVSLQKEKEIV